MEKYNQRILSLQSFKGFYEAYLMATKNYTTYKEAYQSVEDRHYYYYGRHKYSSYESFKSQISKKVTKGYLK